MNPETNRIEAKIDSYDDLDVIIYQDRGLFLSYQIGSMTILSNRRSQVILWWKIDNDSTGNHCIIYSYHPELMDPQQRAMLDPVEELKSKSRKLRLPLLNIDLAIRAIKESKKRTRHKTIRRQNVKNRGRSS